jgi:hypothetical protein
MQRLVLRAAAVSFLLAGCGGQGGAGPSWVLAPVTTPGSTTAATHVATPAETSAATPAPPPEPTFDTTFPPDPDPSAMPAGFIESFGKPVEETGGHGGLPAVELPASVAIDYWVSGTCDFTIGIVDITGPTATHVASFAMRMLGTTVEGTWPVEIKAGSYYVVPGDAEGCRFSVTVRAAS